MAIKLKPVFTVDCGRHLWSNQKSVHVVTAVLYVYTMVAMRMLKWNTWILLYSEYIRPSLNLCISPHKMSTIISLILTLLLFKAAYSIYKCHAPVGKSDTLCYADTPIKGTDVNFAVGYSIGGVT